MKIICEFTDNKNLAQSYDKNQGYAGMCISYIKCPGKIWFIGDPSEEEIYLYHLHRDKSQYINTDRFVYYTTIGELLNDGFELSSINNIGSHNRQGYLAMWQEYYFTKEIEIQEEEVKDGISVYKKYYDVCKDYLKELIPSGVDIKKYFDPSKKSNMNDIVYQFAINLQDYNSMPNIIKFLDADRSSVFNDILKNYDRDDILNAYYAPKNVDYYLPLYEAFCDNFPVRNKNSKLNSWRKYARGIIDTCLYLRDYTTADEFNAHVESFGGSFDITDELQHIYGMGFALACNVIKDLGFTDYAKPDTHTKDVIAAMGLANKQDDKAVINAIRDIAIANEDTAFNVDRTIWLICSGKYFMDNIEIESHKQDLINIINA